MSQRQVVKYDIGEQSTTAWVVKTILARDFRNAVFDVISTAWADQKIQFVASKSENKPDFDAAVSTTNRWQYIQAIDLDTGTPVNWTTWYTFSWAESKQFELNLNADWWVGLKLISWTTGSINSWVMLTDNL